ncbi:exonuclease 3'-5' domain-containing protein 2-like [Branchiostoma floridae]|uniref:Exonuclease 3'-5' domain-containing protein 2 n=1 Tax=Branchiostoma floridae TaxID=7739 RepID=A0A9J7MNT0_BRAFL|nr:exonuclease 3'-5' domain-containing protein 2-like [Branchiostoma floridae]
MIHPMVLMTTSLTICGWVMSCLEHYHRDRRKTFLQRDPAGTRITVVDSQTSCEDVCGRLVDEEALGELQVLGFDCEWVTRGGTTRPVSLLQLASRTGECGLFRVCRLNDGTIPRCVRDLLANKNVLKVGVACWEDSRRLERDYGITVRGCVDLRHLAIRHKSLQSGKLGLQALAEQVLGVKMDKSRTVRCSNWEASKLSEEQITYAANDALVSVDIFTTFLEWKLQQNDKSEKNLRSAVKAMCQGLVDVPFSDSHRGGRKRTARNNKTRPLQHQNEGSFDNEEVGVRQNKELLGQNHNAGSFSNGEVPQNHNEGSFSNVEAPQHQENKAPTPRKVKGYTVRRSPFYHNCQLLAPDGTLLSTIDRKKVQWYLQKELGELVSEDPLTVQLKFEPSGRPSSQDDQYYLSVKDNVCVVCGRTESYIRKNVVPHDYRRHFPREMKDHLSHDILLLCTVCHQQTGHHDNRLRNEIVREFNAPLGSEDNAKFLEDPARRKARTAAKALLRDDNKIPAERKLELETHVKEFYSTEEVTTAMLMEAATLETRIENENFVPHAEKVVRSLLERRDGLMLFEKRWRRHFLDSMKPRYLPPLWSVDHNHGKLERNGPVGHDHNHGKLERNGPVRQDSLAGGDQAHGLDGDN